jgi:hypothetical protein
MVLRKIVGLKRNEVTVRLQKTAWFVFLARYYQYDTMIVAEIGGACGTHGEKTNIYKV